MRSRANERRDARDSCWENLSVPFYPSRNVPLAAYDLAFGGRREQKTSDEIHDRVGKMAEQWRAGDLADPQLRKHRLAGALCAWQIVASGGPADSVKIGLMSWCLSVAGSSLWYPIGRDGTNDDFESMCFRKHSRFTQW